MTTTITGQTVPFGVITAMPQSWPIANSAGAICTTPGNTVVVAGADGAYSLDLPPLSDIKLIYPDGSQQQGTTPADGVKTPISLLQSAHGWTAPR